MIASNGERYRRYRKRHPVDAYSGYRNIVWSIILLIIFLMSEEFHFSGSLWSFTADIATGYLLLLVMTAIQHYPQHIQVED